MVKKRYQLVRVTFTPLKTRIRYEIESPLFCQGMNAPIRDHATYTHRDGAWIGAFGSRAAVGRFLKNGRPVTKRMRLQTLGYDACDYALQPAGPSSTRARKRPRRLS